MAILMMRSMKLEAVRRERRNLHVEDKDKYEEREIWSRMTRSSSTGNLSSVFVELPSRVYEVKYGC
jgi:hypothetical protein